MGDYFMPNNVYHDDVKYIEGAISYEESASSFIDIAAFAQSMAQVGHNSILNSENGWFAFCAGFMYLFHSQWLLRLVNILFAVFSIFLLYKLALQFFNKEVATLSAKLLAYLPYPIFFCCFPFKDQFIMMCLLCCLYIIFKYIKSQRLTRLEISLFVLTIFIIHFTRKGLDALILIVALINYFGQFSSIGMGKKIILSGLLAVVIFLVGDVLLDDVSYKMITYLSERDMSGSRLLSLISINSVWDIWKFPLSYSFVLLLPLDFNQPFDSCYGILSNLNFVMAPIAIGSFVMLFRIRDNKSLFISLLMLYLAVIVMSAMIFRHYFCLLPVENIMNVVVFVLVVILTALVIYNKLKVFKVGLFIVALGLFISSSIEALQFFLKRGFSELDDVFHNTLGCLIGFMIVVIIKGIWLLQKRYLMN